MDKATTAAARAIRWLMKENGIKSIYKLSQITEVKYTTLVGIMNEGRSPREETITKICKAFNLEIEDFYNMPDNTNIAFNDMDAGTKALYSFFKRNRKDPNFPDILKKLQQMPPEGIDLILKSLNIIEEDESTKPITKGSSKKNTDK